MAENRKKKNQQKLPWWLTPVLLLAVLAIRGNKNLILDVTAPTIKETFANAVLVRRTAIKDGDRTFGYPSIVNLGVLCNHDEHLETALAAMFVVKYGSIIVMDKVGYAEALPLYGLRQNIFTDPQKPMKVAPAGTAMDAMACMPISRMARSPRWKSAFSEEEQTYEQ